MAAIYTMDGNELTAGLQGCDVCDEAIQVAGRLADTRHEPVHLCDDDGEWIVFPSRDGKRPLAVEVEYTDDESWTSSTLAAISREGY